MHSSFEVVSQDLGPSVEIEEHRSMFGMVRAFSKDFPRLVKYLKDQKVNQGGPPYARYLDMDWEKETNQSGFSAALSLLTKRFHFQAGIPSERVVEEVDDIHLYNPGLRTYAKGVHYGPYRDVSTMYKDMYQWLTEQGYTAEAESIERYTNDPTEVAESEIETEVYIPIH